MCCDARVRIGFGRLVLSCSSPLSYSPFGVFAVTALLVWCRVFVAGLCDCGMAVVSTVCCPVRSCVAGYEMAGGLVLVHCSLSSSLSFFFFFVLVFGVVRAQLCEHARYPRTPLCFLSSCCLLSFSSSSRLAFLLLLEWRWVVHHVSECSVGMTAMGSLSLSSSFFW